MMLIGYEDHPLLPANASEGRAHILKEISDGVIDIPNEDVVSELPKLDDFITNFLYRLKDRPDALSDFFDPDVASFKLLWLCHPMIGEESKLFPSMIWRKGDVIVVSLVQH